MPATPPEDTAGATAATGPASSREPTRPRPWPLVGLILLIILGLFYVFGAVADLTADASAGIPADHQHTFTTLAGKSFSDTKAAAPGSASYITLLERGYALHELTFALLFLAIVAFPFRHRQRWAWWAAWLPMIANLGYTLTFGVHDPTILVRSLIATIGLPVLLLAFMPAFFPRRRADAPTPRVTRAASTCQIVV